MTRKKFVSGGVLITRLCQATGIERAANDEMKVPLRPIGESSRRRLQAQKKRRLDDVIDSNEEEEAEYAFDTVAVELSRESTQAKAGSYDPTRDQACASVYDCDRFLFEQIWKGHEELRARFKVMVDLKDQWHLTMKNRYKKLDASFNRLNVNLIQFMDSMKPPVEPEHVEVEEEVGDDEGDDEGVYEEDDSDRKCHTQTDKVIII